MLVHVVSQACKRDLVHGKRNTLTSLAAQLCRPTVFPAHFSFVVCHRGVLRRALFAGADLLAALALGPLEVLAFHRVGVEDGFVPLRALFGVARYRV